jgi:hypothetical protein
MTLKSLDAIVSGAESDGYVFHLHAHNNNSAEFQPTCAALKLRVADVLGRLRANAALSVESIQLGKCLISASAPAAAAAAAFDPANPATWDHAKSVRNAYMAARSNESKAHALDCDFLVGLHVVVPADVPPALAPFAVDHQRLAMLFEIALSELLAADAALLDKAHLLPPLAAWDEVHKSANATLIFLLIKVAHRTKATTPATAAASK